MTAVNAAGEGAISDYDAGSTIIVITPPLAPTGVTATDGNIANEVTLTWVASESAASYNIYRSSTADGGLFADCHGPDRAYLP